MRKALLLALVGVAGLAATAPLHATDWHPIHTTTDYHPPTTTGEHPPVTVTVTTPPVTVTTPPVTVAAPPVTVTVTSPPPAAQTVTQTLPGVTTTTTVTTPPTIRVVERPYPPCARGYKRAAKGNCIKTVTKIKIKRVIRDRIICPDPPPPPRCEGDCSKKKLHEGGSG